MNRTANRHFSPRDTFARFFIVWALGLALALSVAPQRALGQEVVGAALVSNASPGELESIQGTLDRLERAALARDANALAFFGASVPADKAPLALRERITHLAVTPRGALVRQVFALSRQGATPATLSSGAQELWLARNADGSFALTPTRFAAPPDALAQLAGAVESEWDSVGGDQTPAVLDVIASRIGGRWIALRRQRWDGQLSDASEENRAPKPREFLLARMSAAPRSRAVNAHFLLQKGAAGWFGVGAAFEEERHIPPAADSAAALWRERIAGSEYTSAASHRDFGLTLGAVGLWNEAADELQKAELLQPGIVGAARLKEAENNRAADPQNRVERQIESEQNVGLAPEHPQDVISALQRRQRATPSVIVALRLALEYSRLAEEERAAAWMRVASDLMKRGAVRRQDADWVQLLVEHGRERSRLARVKPSNILRSALFTVRVWPGDKTAIPLLAALEEAQHTVYAGFGIPMGNSEVILWRNQGEFARYTTQFSAQGGSEFVAALTLTKLVSTGLGPLVLGEEINTFTDPRDTKAIFSTVAHEYGHVAVRQLAKGRLVPVWFNEGIATSVEGGYEGYIARVRRAARAGTLLSMREMTAWNVDGERAFLAYSQANSIVDFMVQEWGKKAVLEILRQIGRDVPPETAFRAVTGLGQNQIWNRWSQEGIR